MKFIIITTILLLFIAGHIYVVQRAWILMPSNNIGRIVLIAVSTLVISSIFIFFLFGEMLPVVVSSFFYKIGTSWIFILLYFFLLALIKDLIRLLHLVPKEAFSHYTKDNWMGLTLAVGFITMLMICGYLKYNWKIKVDVPLVTEKEIAKRESLKIVAISDLHLGYGIGKSELMTWVDLINGENPDMVIIAGDIIDNSVRPLNEDNMAECFKQIKAPLGIYACLGNHEYISGIDKSTRFIQEAGIHLLRDSHALIDSSFYVVGRDDRSNSARKPLSELVAPLDKDKLMILLDHQPYNLEESAANGIDVQFSGHTHGGQVWPISLVTKWIYEDSHGHIKKDKTDVYVSSGIGLWGGKFRIGTQSEYVVINIKKKR